MCRFPNSFRKNIHLQGVVCVCKKGAMCLYEKTLSFTHITYFQKKTSLFEQFSKERPPRRCGTCKNAICVQKRIAFSGGTIFRMNVFVRNVLERTPTRKFRNSYARCISVYYIYIYKLYS